MRADERPRVPAWRPGPPSGEANEIRRFMHEITAQRDQLWGVHVDVTFPGAATAVRVATGLGGSVKGYMVVRRSADVRVWDANPPSGSDPVSERGVHWLQASGAGTVTLYLY